MIRSPPVTSFRDIPVLRKRFFRFAIAPGSVLIIIGVARYIRASDIGTLATSAELVIVVIAWCVWFRVHLRDQARAVLVKTRGLTCTNCGYSLVGMDENGQCPECGASYYADHLCQCWSRAAGFPLS
jgi:hypothetical protein